MPNARFSEFETDKVKKETKKSMEKKNVDGRLDGSAFDSDHAAGVPKMPEVVDPNASVPSIGSQSGVEGGH